MLAFEVLKVLMIQHLIDLNNNLQSKVTQWAKVSDSDVNCPWFDSEQSYSK